LLAASTLLLVLANSQAQTNELNIYSARHYPTDEALYSDFTKATGIKINRVDSDDAGILARLKAEGTASAADVILLVDAARLWRGGKTDCSRVSARLRWNLRFPRICAARLTPKETSPGSAFRPAPA
jgi:ABC-type thiamine transport system substrate-binding protein